MDPIQTQNTSKKNYWIAGVVIVILIIAGIVIFKASSGTPVAQVVPGLPSTAIEPINSSMVLPYGQVTLRIGESGSFRGITIRPTAVTEDSRCAAGVQCIWAGRVVVTVESTLDSTATLTNSITLGSTTAVDTFTVSLVSVTPGQVAGTQISNADYRLTFDVHQSGSGAGTGAGTTGSPVVQSKG